MLFVIPTDGTKSRAEDSPTFARVGAIEDYPGLLSGSLNFFLKLLVSPGAVCFVGTQRLTRLRSPFRSW